MNIIILAGSLNGTASRLLPIIYKSKKINVVAIVYNKGIIKNKKRLYKKKFKKIIKIGLFGALNGFRIRKWYKPQSQNFENIKEFSQNNKIAFYETNSINCESTQIYFKNSNADLGISLGNTYISEKIFNIPKLGMINVHHEILPDFKGAQSIIWQLYNKSNFSGFTIHKINNQIDGGDIIYKKKILIKFEKSLCKTVKNNYQNLVNESGASLLKILNNYNHYSQISYEQNQSSYYTTPTIFQFFRIYRNFLLLKKNSSR